MSRKIIDYYTCLETFEEIDESVKELIDAGWQPHGNIIELNGFIAQPMVKYKEELDAMVKCEEKLDAKEEHLKELALKHKLDYNLVSDWVMMRKQQNER